MTMQSTDPIADMLSRIRNAIAVNKNEVSLPHSKLKETIARLLASSGYLVSAKPDGEGKDKRLNIVINDETASATITSIKRLSSPGRRQYVAADEIPTVRRGRGMVIISTSQGVMSGQDARTKHLGGELICEIY